MLAKLQKTSIHIETYYPINISNNNFLSNSSYCIRYFKNVFIICMAKLLQFRWLKGVQSTITDKMAAVHFSSNGIAIQSL